jgi:hypothetical protein
MSRLTGRLPSSETVSFHLHVLSRSRTDLTVHILPQADFWPVVDSYPLQDFQRLVCLTIAVRNVQNPANWLRAVAQLGTRNR